MIKTIVLFCHGLTSSTTSLSVASGITNVNDVTQPSTFVIYTPTILIKNPCEFTLLKNANLYEIPAARKIRELKQGEIIIVTRCLVLSDEGWLLVENESQVNRWVDGSVISGLGSCAPIIYDLADSVLLKKRTRRSAGYI
ncbi:MAG: hypothetical protein H6634_12440 [Anaerolineales bacterium]|nr:hypothetical protein [Anaerolineales bacterium]